MQIDEPSGAAYTSGIVAGLSTQRKSLQPNFASKLHKSLEEAEMRHLMVLMIALLVPATAMAKADCAEDKEKFCKEVVEAKGKVRACLNEHKAELSESCKARLEAKGKDKEAKAKEKNAKDSAKMGEGEGTHTAPNPGSPPESDTNKVDQPNVPSNDTTKP